jgi:rRNA pseudouridine-1189 N-methylase Emg1 (Nep1/Mra1 family)
MNEADTCRKLVVPRNCNLDWKNPRAKEDIVHLPLERIAASILDKEQRIAEIVQRIQKLLAEGVGS